MDSTDKPNVITLSSDDQALGTLMAELSDNLFMKKIVETKLSHVASREECLQESEALANEITQVAKELLAAIDITRVGRQLQQDNPKNTAISLQEEKLATKYAEITYNPTNKTNAIEQLRDSAGAEKFMKNAEQTAYLQDMIAKSIVTTIAAIRRNDQLEILAPEDALEAEEKMCTAVTEVDFLHKNSPIPVEDRGVAKILMEKTDSDQGLIERFWMNPDLSLIGFFFAEVIKTLDPVADEKIFIMLTGNKRFADVVRSEENGDINMIWSQYKDKFPLQV